MLTGCHESQLIKAIITAVKHDESKSIIFASTSKTQIQKMCTTSHEILNGLHRKTWCARKRITQTPDQAGVGWPAVESSWTGDTLVVLELEPKLWLLMELIFAPAFPSSDSHADFTDEVAAAAATVSTPLPERWRWINGSTLLPSSAETTPRSSALRPPKSPVWKIKIMISMINMTDATVYDANLKLNGEMKWN